MISKWVQCTYLMNGWKMNLYLCFCTFSVIFYCVNAQNLVLPLWNQNIKMLALKLHLSKFAFIKFFHIFILKERKQIKGLTCFGRFCSLLLCFCYFLVTFLLHFCYVFVMFLLRRCYVLVTFLLHSCYILVTFLLHSCYVLFTFLLCSCYVLVPFLLRSIYVLVMFFLRFCYVLVTFLLCFCIYFLRVEIWQIERNASVRNNKFCWLSIFSYFHYQFWHLLCYCFNTVVQLFN